MRFGLAVGSAGLAGGERGEGACVEMAEHAEALGFDSVWVRDHLVTRRGPARAWPASPDGADLPWDAPYPEPLVLLSALAARTRRVELGTGVLVLPSRHPAVTAKMLATSDLLSGGRVVLGAGAGWRREEFEALGLPADHFARRDDVTDDYLRAIKEMWTNTGPSRYSGEHVRFRDVGIFPKPARRPHPPIIIGGKGPRALRRAVLLGDGFQAPASGIDELAREVEQMRRFARHDRRDPDELEVQLAHPVTLHDRPVDGERPPLAGSVEQVCEDLRRYARAGLRHLIATPALEPVTDPWQRALGGARRLASEVLPAFGSGART